MKPIGGDLLFQGIAIVVKSKRRIRRHQGKIKILRKAVKAIKNSECGSTIKCRLMKEACS